MGLSGLEIYKHLPKGNCKECGLSTCLAFAMKVAAGQASLEACPRLTPEGKAALGEAGAPPQLLVKIGDGDRSVSIGQETVLFRHEEKFHHPTAVAIRISDDLDDEAIRNRAKAIAGLQFDRMGAHLTVDLVAVGNPSGNMDRFIRAAQLAGEASRKPLVLMSDKVENLTAAGKALAAGRPLLWGTNGAFGSEAALEAVKDLGLPVCIEAAGFDKLAELSQAAKKMGLKELVLSPGSSSVREGLEFLTQSRRAAIAKKFRPLGYPIGMAAMGSDPVQAVVEACWYVLKYAGVVVTDIIKPEQVLTLLTTRQDIYTDPQKPVQVPPGLHTVGEPGPDAPVLITTNFALSYYSVEPEVEASRIPAYILAVETEGTSVLTAWAADKLNAKTIDGALKKSNVGEKVRHHKVVLPGLVAVLSGAVKDESGWEVLVGPKEASGLVSFLKNQWKP